MGKAAIRKAISWALTSTTLPRSSTSSPSRLFLSPLLPRNLPDAAALPGPITPWVICVGGCWCHLEIGNSTEPASQFPRKRESSPPTAHVPKRLRSRFPAFAGMTWVSQMIPILAGAVTGDSRHALILMPSPPPRGPAKPKLKLERGVARPCSGKKAFRLATAFAQTRVQNTPVKSITNRLDRPQASGPKS